MIEFERKIAFLPAPLRDRCIRCGNETGWKKSDVVDVIECAPEASMATLGGQIQYRFPDATCELYWLSYDPSPRSPNETWTKYCRRSSKEAISKFHDLPEPAGIREQAKTFSYLKDKLEQGVDIDEYQVFIIYFVGELGYHSLP